MQITLHLKKEIVNDSLVTREEKTGKEGPYTLFYFAGEHIWLQGDKYFEFKAYSFASFIPKQIRKYVIYVELVDQITTVIPRLSGKYRVSSKATGFVNFGNNELEITIKGINLGAVEKLYDLIRNGGLEPTSNWDNKQPGAPEPDYSWFKTEKEEEDEDEDNDWYSFGSLS